VNSSNKHLIKPTVLLIYGGLWSPREEREDKLVVGEAQMLVGEAEKLITSVQTRWEKLTVSILAFI
jgi:hypothetical protein